MLNRAFFAWSQTAMWPDCGLERNRSTREKARMLRSLHVAQRLLTNARLQHQSGVFLSVEEVEDLVEMASIYRQSTTTALTPPTIFRRPGFYIFQRLRVLLFPRLPKAASSNFPELESFRAR